MGGEDARPNRDRRRSAAGRASPCDLDNNKDVIDLRRFQGIDNFSEVLAQAQQVGADTVIDLGAAVGRAAGNDVLTLVNFDLAQLDPADFRF